MSNDRKIDDIQLLRAVAIVLVIIFHAKWDLFGFQNTIFKQFYLYFGGDVGVDLFFVISGFVIARSLLPQLENASESKNTGMVLVIFWVKRVFRLLPSAWFWLVATLLFSLFFNQSGAFGNFQAAYEGVIAAVLHVANVRFMDCFAQFECGPTFVYWSLSLEEQFYLVFPIFAIIARKHLIAVSLLLVLTQFFESLSVPSVFRFSGLVIGVLIAIFSKTQTWRLLEPVSLARHRLFSMGLFGFILLILVTSLGEGLHIVSGSLKYNLVAILSGILVLIASYDGDYLMRDGLIKRIMMWFGSRSYAMYLVHIPAFYLVREIYFISNIIFSTQMQMIVAHSLLALVLIIVMSELSFRFVETYWVHRGKEVIHRLLSFSKS